MESDKKSHELTILLEHAADGRPGAIEAFFEALLRTEVWVALDEVAATVGPKERGNVPEVGKTGAEDHGLCLVDYEGKDCLMIFTEERFVADWAKREFPCEKKEFKSLLWMVTEDTWMYLNPCQETGKEITAWEIEQLRNGPEAIRDLALALSEDPLGDIEVRSDSELYPSLKHKLIPLLEIAKGLQEAFLIAVKEGESVNEKPMLGLRYAKVEPGVKSYIRKEIEETFEEYGEESGQAVLIIDDLGDPKSPNHAFFEGAVPFFIGAASINPQKRGGTPLSRASAAAKEKFSALFRKGPENRPEKSADKCPGRDEKPDK